MQRASQCVDPNGQGPDFATTSAHTAICHLISCTPFVLASFSRPTFTTAGQTPPGHGRQAHQGRPDDLVIPPIFPPFPCVAKRKCQPRLVEQPPTAETPDALAKPHPVGIGVPAACRAGSMRYEGSRESAASRQHKFRGEHRPAPRQATRSRRRGSTRRQNERKENKGNGARDCLK